ncbi:MAG: hypothetical protein AB7J35_07560 [Dehalococcoidia bacterium]
MPDTPWVEVLLEELGNRLTYPETPDLRAEVMGGLEGEASARTSLPKSLAIAAVGVGIVVAGIVVGFSHDARSAIAEFLGLAVDGERIEVLPTPPAGTTATPFPTPIPLKSIAREISREKAEATTRLTLPPSLGGPSRFYSLSETLPVIVADYGRIQIWFGEYFADQYFVAKGIVGGGTVVDEVQVNGNPGYWVSGGERIVTLVEATGTPVAGTQRTVSTNALIWVQDRLYRRIEGAADVAEALSLATEMPH